jgi:uncharacterized protein (DUF2147 family)
MKLFFVLIISFFCSITIQAQSSKADLILGDWISPKRDLIVRCYKENNRYYGKIVWFYKYYPPEPEESATPEDQWVNTIVMNHFSYSNNEWNEGEIYDIKKGKTYDAFIELVDNNTLKVTGYMFWRVFSETITFNKYKEARLPAFN